MVIAQLKGGSRGSLVSMRMSLSPLMILPIAMAACVEQSTAVPRVDDAPATAIASHSNRTATPTPLGVTSDPVDVALTNSQVVSLVTGLLDPSEQPKVEFVRLTRFADIHRTFDLIGSVRPADLGVDELAPYFVVSATVHAMIPQGKSNIETAPSLVGQASEQLEQEVVPMVLLIDATSGRVELWGVPRMKVDSPGIERQLRPLTARLTLSPRPVDKPPDPEPTVDSTQLPIGKDLKVSSMSAEAQDVLRAFPVVAGSEWTYERNSYEYFLWSGIYITESVVAAKVLDTHTYVAVVRRQLTAQPDSRGGQFVNETALGFIEPGSTETKSVYVLVHDNELFRTDSPSELNRWVKYFKSHDPVPTLASVYEHLTQQADRPVPLLQFPLKPGFLAPEPDSGADWTIKRQVNVHAPAGQFDACYETFHAGNANEWFWFCPEFGIVRTEYQKGGSAGGYASTELTRARIHGLQLP